MYHSLSSIVICIAVLLFTSTCGLGSTRNKEPFPILPIYPYHSGLDEGISPTTNERFIKYSTNASPDTIYTYYRNYLTSSGWELDNNAINGYIAYEYHNGSANPAFSLIIIVEEGDKNTVILREFISGPFAWPDEIRQLDLKEFDDK